MLVVFVPSYKWFQYPLHSYLYQRYIIACFHSISKWKKFNWNTQRYVGICRTSSSTVLLKFPWEKFRSNLTHGCQRKTFHNDFSSFKQAFSWVFPLAWLERWRLSIPFDFKPSQNCIVLLKTIILFLYCFWRSLSNAIWYLLWSPR